MEKGCISHEIIKREYCLIDYIVMGDEKYQLYEHRQRGDGEDNILVSNQGWYVYTSESIAYTLYSLDTRYTRFSML